ncbi:lytic transglycosylase domain-containing protein [Sphingomonas canadensis]|uniref:Lytic transglycosylase domain-containing protein n=1 Tax=Sphingomonas canadensis TaxID=1219257 RepID=A0ABW3H9P5_9SPHN|nr:lytic transglycosylase domain-containing protein [Sphingomonas canadensis]MCW3836706.1 lytic transglycosylase domain-containing protein [Sphingomonas canadensis]
MSLRILLAAALVALPVSAPAFADGGDAGDRPAGTGASAVPAAMRDGDGVPDQLTAEQRTAYRAIFAAIRGQRWDEARARLDAMKAGPLHAFARAELYTAKGSPRVELDPLVVLLREAPELPQAAQLLKMAQGRGAVSMPQLPALQRLSWLGSSPTRQRLRSVKSDSAATEIALAIQPHVKSDNGPAAEALVDRFGPDLTSDALTEWQQKVAWIYYVSGDDANARRMAAKAQAGSGEWAAQGDWVQGLAAWRQQDCETARAAFASVGRRGGDSDIRAAGLYWASRADMACGRPESVQANLKAASVYSETFYGLLARQALGIADRGEDGETFLAEDWQVLARLPNVRAAAALIEIGETQLADELLRHQARLCNTAQHKALARLASRLSLPTTALWLSHNGPAGAQPVIEARYPAPNWAPAGGWRVDRALVFAHTLQESRFNAEIKSAAGAMGLMQVKLGAATDVGRRKGVTYASSDLIKPAVNMEIGQSYLEQMRDSPLTQGLLPKVIASYNAGPSPVSNWNTQIRDNGDPLLYIESIPYWETRGYVMTVLRNYWMYELQEGRQSVSREALVQGLWPRFPGLPGDTAVRVGGGGGPVIPAPAPANRAD